MAMITASGLGSNLDVNGLVSQLMAVERQPLRDLDVKEAQYQAKLSAYGAIKGALSTLQNSIQALGSASRFQVFKAVLGDATIASATSSSIAVPGRYDLDVTQLARSQKLAAVGKSALDTQIGTGTLQFDFGKISGGTFDSVTGKYTGATFTASGTTRSVTIDSAHSSLSGIRDAINGAGIGVRAEIVNDGGANPYRLVLSVTETGVENSVRINVSGDAGLQGLLAHDPAGTQSLSETATAQDAKLKVNGLDVVKSGNTISDVIRGVTLNLTKAGATSLDVTGDSDRIAKSASNFVKAYNDLASIVREVSYVDSQTGERGILTGDNMLGSLKGQIQAVMNQAFDKPGAAFSGLSQVGIRFTREGTLEMNDAQFSQALSTSYQSVVDLFAYRKADATDATVEGVGYRLNQLLGSMLDGDGLIANRTEGINASIRGLDARREGLQRRLEGIETRYRAQFSSLDGMISNMLQTSNFLTQQLSNLPGR